MRKKSILIKLLYFLLVITYIGAECPRNRPLSLFNICMKTFCSKNDFETNFCKIDNEIIKTQWLKNIILIGYNGCGYVNIETYSNKDLIVEAINLSGTDKKRIFYALKQNGRNFFGNEADKSDTPFHSMELTESGIEIQYPNILNIENENDNKEYLVSISNGLFYEELYDFENNKVFLQSSSTLFGNTISNFKYTPFKISSDDISYTIFASIFKGTNNYFSLYKLKVVSNDSQKNIEIVKKSQNYINQIGDMTSCYKTNSENIICFFQTDNEFNIIAFDYELEEEAITSIPLESSEIRFYKCIHIKEDIGGFIYYKDEFIITFKKYNKINRIFENCLKDINLNKTNFSSEIKINDFLKISESKIIFISFTDNVLYIVLINIINSDNIVIRYYSIELKTYYNKIIKSDSKAHLYKNFIAYGFNFIESSVSDDYLGEGHNVGFIIFSYPNSTDFYFDLEDYIFNHNNIAVYQFNVNLGDYVMIENNLFGYVYSGIKILDLKDCNQLSFLSLNEENTPISVNYILKENEYFKIKLLNKDKSFNCRIEFALILTEPDYEDFDNYPIIKDTTYGNDDEISFNMQKDFYIGKTGHYNLDMKYHLSNNCEKYCKLCSFDLNNIINRCLICKYNYTLIENINGINDKECFNESSSKSLDEIINNLDELMKNTDPNQTYFMDGDGYSVIIKDYDEIVEESTVNIDFSKCMQKLRLNFPGIKKFRVLQINMKKEDESSLTDQVEYQMYDDNGNSLDLSICNDAEIKIEYEITDSSKLDIDKIKKFSNLGVDVFNIKDEFFNDICRPYSDDETNSDMILSDRVSDIYQNVSLCGDQCDYESFNVEKMSVSCTCKVKLEVSSEPEKNVLASSIESAFFDSNFGVIKCYNLVFSLKGKLKNAGFWIFGIFIILHIPLYILLFKIRLNPIKNYIKTEMENNGYYDWVEDEKEDNIQTYKKTEENQLETQGEYVYYNQILTNVKKFRLINPLVLKYDYPPKRYNSENASNEENNNEDNEHNKTENFDNVDDNNKDIKIKSSFYINMTKILEAEKKKEKINENENENKEGVKKIVVNNLSSRKKKRIKLFNNKRVIRKISNNFTNDVNSNEILNSDNQSHTKETNKKLKIKKNDEKPKNNTEEEKNYKMGDHLILMNAKNSNNYIPLISYYNLDNYSYDEAIMYENRSFFRLFLIYLMSKESILNTFYYKQPLELMPLRILIFIFNNSCDIALNSLFYLSDNISDKYHYEGKNALLFSMVNNIVISLFSTVISFLLIYFSQSLVQSTNKITQLFRNEEDLLKSDKKYKVRNDKIHLIKRSIIKILKCLKIKILIFLVFEILLMLFYLYYVTAFCHVYYSTQTSWLMDCVTSYGISLLTAIVVSFIFTLLYLLSVKCKCKFIYNITLFIYSAF